MSSDVNTIRLNEGFLDYLDKEHQKPFNYLKENIKYYSRRDIYNKPTLYFGKRTFFERKGSICKVNLEDLTKVLGHKRWIRVNARPGLATYARETLKGGLIVKRKHIDRPIIKSNFSPQEYELIKHEMVLYMKSDS